MAPRTEFVRFSPARRAGDADRRPADSMAAARVSARGSLEQSVRRDAHAAVRIAHRFGDAFNAFGDGLWMLDEVGHGIDHAGRDDLVRIGKWSAPRYHAARRIMSAPFLAIMMQVALGFADTTVSMTGRRSRGAGRCPSPGATRPPLPSVRAPSTANVGRRRCCQTKFVFTAATTQAARWPTPSPGSIARAGRRP